jgi:cytochrome b involved in lipid metabolism
MSKTFTPAEVASHKTPDQGLYIIVDNSVFDVTKFVDEHPGGAKILKRVAGKDASKQFWKVNIPLLLLLSLQNQHVIVMIGYRPSRLLKACD